MVSQISVLAKFNKVFRDRPIFVVTSLIEQIIGEHRIHILRDTAVRIFLHHLVECGILIKIIRLLIAERLAMFVIQTLSLLVRVRKCLKLLGQSDSGILIPCVELGDLRRIRFPVLIQDIALLRLIDPG